jgi:hypothetical protein
MKEFFTYFGGLIALINLLIFAKGIWSRKIPSSTPASFMMWTVLDVIILASTLFAHQPGWLAGAYVVGATAVTAAMFARGKWLWSYKETICAVGAGITTYVWFHWTSSMAVLAGVCAMTVAGMPIWIDMWKNPIKGTWPVWTFTVVACICTLLGSDLEPDGHDTCLGWYRIQRLARVDRTLQETSCPNSLKGKGTTD